MDKKTLNVIGLIAFLFVVLMFVMVSSNISSTVQNEISEQKEEELLNKRLNAVAEVIVERSEKFQERNLEKNYEAVKDYDADWWHQTTEEYEEVEEYEKVDRSLNVNEYYVTDFDFDLINGKTIELTVTYKDGGELKQITTADFVINNRYGEGMVNKTIVSINDTKVIMDLRSDLMEKAKKTFTIDLDYVQIIKEPVKKIITSEGEENIYDYSLNYGAFYNGKYIEEEIRETPNFHFISDLDNKDDCYIIKNVSFDVSEGETPKVHFKVDLLSLEENRLGNEYNFILDSGDSIMQ